MARGLTVRGSPGGADQRRRAVVVGAVLLVVAFVQACSRAAGGAGASDGPVPTVEASGGAAVSPDDCIVINHDVEPEVLDADQLAPISSVVLEADYLGPAGPAVWNTPGGHRPTPAETKASSPGLSTPAKLGNTDSVRGKLAEPGRVLIPGGTSGCDSEVYSNSALAPLVVGQRYVFFLAPAFDTAKTPLPDATLLRAWPVAPDGSVRSDTGTTITRAGLTDVLSAHPFKPAGG